MRINWNAISTGVTCTTYTALAVFVIGFVIALYLDEQQAPKGDDAVVLAKSGTVTAQWNYQQLPMHECRWCGRTVNLNRHHAVPQAANPALRDVKENLIVLCRDCHFVLGHRCNWKQYNPDVMYIATHFTNCVKSADTRAAIEKPNGGPFTPVHADDNVFGFPTNQTDGTDWRESVTNRASLDEALKRLFARGMKVQYKDRLDSDEEWRELPPEKIPVAVAEHLVQIGTNAQAAAEWGYVTDFGVTGDGKIIGEIKKGIGDGTEGHHSN